MALGRMTASVMDDRQKKWGRGVCMERDISPGLLLLLKYSGQWDQIWNHIRKAMHPKFEGAVCVTQPSFTFVMTVAEQTDVDLAAWRTECGHPVCVDDYSTDIFIS